MEGAWSDHPNGKVRVHVSLVSQQHFNNGLVASLGCPEQGRCGIAVTRVDIRAPVQKQLNHCLVGISRCPNEGRGSDVFPVYIRAVIEQEIRNAQFAGNRSQAKLISC